MSLLERYPQIAERYESLCLNARHEMLTQLMQNDESYRKLCSDRKDASILLKAALNALKDGYALFEQYSDTVYAQEVYELEKMYRQGFFDALAILCELGIV